MLKLYPCLWFDGQAEEAARFYVSLMPDSHVDNVWRSPADTPSGPAGMVLTVDFTLFGQHFQGLNGGPDFKFNESVSFVVEVEDQAEVDRLWDAMTAGGGQPGPCGWLKDRFGLSWQIVPRRLIELIGGPDPDRARRAMEAMLQMEKIEIRELERAADATTRTLEAPGATLIYDIRESAASNEPPLMLIGSPMGAAGFTTLAGYFADRTLITYDPRGSERSVKADPTSQSTPDQHADDLHAIIAAVGGPVDLFASSGGAVNALALVARHPEDVRTLVAHEPPLASVLPDREAAMAATSAVNRTYMERGGGFGMAHFIAAVAYTGEFTPDWADQPGPDPQMFGMPATDDGSRTDVLLAQNMITCTHYEPDFDALKRAKTRIVMAAGEEGAGTMANRGAHAVAERLGSTPVIFPSGHAGFLGGEYGQQGEPEAFAAKLREVLTAD